MALSDEMIAYMDENVGDRRMNVARFKSLFYALKRDGYFESTYAAEKTFNARDTFRLKAGNCLSYTTMFITLSRYAGLDASFQVVDVPPSWDADSGYLIRYTHINALMRGVKLEKAGGEDFAVDFNSVHPDPEYRTRIVSDQYAESLFYANRSVDSVRSGDMRSSFAYMRRAIELVPHNPDLWINLGALYAKVDQDDAAIAAFEVALQIDRDNKGAIAGLSRAYYGKGDFEKSDFYAEQVQKYRDRNAYYHFALAQSRYEREEYSAALQAINTAIDIKRKSGRFYFMKGLTQQKLGNSTAARKSFEQAQRYGQFRDLKLRYVNELAGASSVSFSQF